MRNNPGSESGPAPAVDPSTDAGVNAQRAVAFRSPRLRIVASAANRLICRNSANAQRAGWRRNHMIRKLKSGEYRLYSRKKDPKTGKRRNLGTFQDRAAAEKHEREVQHFKRAG
jgi:hypothetical protein